MRFVEVVVFGGVCFQWSLLSMRLLSLGVLY